ncbi:hypothetical protein EN883_03940 [Mesorhizobium sp. M7A.F.Ca.AU.002.06.1.1]|uniref:hypothetical protein n=2 Tax=Mesorhizobium TaxID=68287 RepID=UPI000FCA45A3|nr:MULTISPECIES: hypothetical protein [unclassified Mesorhizobium]RVC05816.1 hypothetical protein EN883_03940 [Mesorhizobium sp. M7A.F.Ca.AU.002.06.1.1]RVC26700.1 hypothetical protein EN879_00590 [Mesorhizobium sp. M7A.F.Ca.AU.002.02.1.1]
MSVVGGAAGPGHNRSAEQLSDDQLQGLTRQHAAKRAKLLEAEKKTKADRMNFDKIIKSDLGATGLANIKLLLDLETPEGEARIKADMERQAMVARWAGLAIGTQGALFDQDRRPVEDRAFDDGKRDGMSGKTLATSHASGTEAYNKYVEGWHAGQAINAAGIRQKPPEAELLRKEGAEVTGLADEFDQASDGGSTASSDVSDDDEGGEPWPDDVDISDREPAETL